MPEENCSTEPPAYCPAMEIALINKFINVQAPGLVSTFPGKDPDFFNTSIHYFMTHGMDVGPLAVAYCPFCGGEVPKKVGHNADDVRDFLTRYKVI